MLGSVDLSVISMECSPCLLSKSCVCLNKIFKPKVKISAYAQPTHTIFDTMKDIASLLFTVNHSSII